MSKQKIILLLSILFLVFYLSESCYAFKLLTKDEALASVFGDSKVVTETKPLSGKPFEKIKERLGGKLIHEQAGAQASDVEESESVDFLFGTKDGQKIGVAIIDSQPGKWGTVEFIIAMDLKGNVTNVKVMSHQEVRGRPITESGFLNQFKGKTGKDPLALGKDIVGISGATISADCAAFTVKKAIIMYEEFYLNK